jgi:hypothetical protein
LCHCLEADTPVFLEIQAKVLIPGIQEKWQEEFGCSGVEGREELVLAAVVLRYEGFEKLVHVEVKVF